MNLSKLFEIQKVLDERIIDKHGLQGHDLLPDLILALRVELGELANEWRGFKFWSNNQEPRTEHECEVCEGEGSFTLSTEQINAGEGERVTFIDCKYCNGDGYLDKNPLLEEYVDCLHFILSIGLRMGYTFTPTSFWESGTTTVQFNDLFHAVATFYESVESDWDEHEKQENYDNLMGGFLGLGKMLGLTWEQIEQAYMSKNKVNHERQESGY